MLFILKFKVVCTGFPEKGQSVSGFRFYNHQRPCQLKQQKNRITGYKLRDYVNPPCQMEYTCASNYAPLFTEIECREDGIFDKKAYCFPNVRNWLVLEV